MTFLVLKDFTKNSTKIRQYGVMSDAKIRKSFDLNAERGKVTDVDEGELANFVADEIDYQENQDIPISYLIKMLDESSITSFSLGNTKEKGFHVNIKMDNFRRESDQEVVDRIAVTLTKAEDDLRAEKERFKLYKELQKEFGNI